MYASAQNVHFVHISLFCLANGDLNIHSFKQMETVLWMFCPPGKLLSLLTMNCCNYIKQTINLTPLVSLNICMLCVITETVCAVFSSEEKTEYQKHHYFG